MGAGQEDHQRLHPDRHRRRPLRRWRAAGGAGRQGHDRRADRAGPRQIGRGGAGLLRRSAPSRRRRAISRNTPASISACPPMAASSSGISARTIRTSTSASTAGSRSTPWRRSGRRPWMGWVSPTFRTISWRRPSRTAASCTFSRTGARLVPAITSTTRAAANPRRHSRLWWMRSVTEHKLCLSSGTSLATWLS